MAQQDEIVKDTQSEPIPPLKEIFFLDIRVVSGRELKASDLNGSSDPFVKVIANKQSWVTKTMRKNLNPTWNEETSFVFFEPCKEVEFEVWDWDQNTSPDSMGKISVKMGKDYEYKDNGQAFEGELKLKKVKKGFITVRVSGKSVKPLELEERIGTLKKEVDAQNEEIQGKEAEKQQCLASQKANQDTVKELKRTQESKTKELDGINNEILQQQSKNKTKQLHIAQLKKEKADLEGKVKTKREQIKLQQEKLAAEQQTLDTAESELKSLNAADDKDYWLMAKDVYQWDWM